jgi:DNA-binding transcriptional MerR regulator
MNGHEDGFKVKEDILTSLFSMFRDSLNQVYSRMDKQADAILALERTLKEGVQLGEIKQLLTEAGRTMQDVDTCTETISTRSDALTEYLKKELMPKINDIHGKLWKVIAAIVIAFALLTAVYFVGRFTVEKKETTAIEQNIGKEIDKKLEQRLSTIEQEINANKLERIKEYGELINLIKQYNKNNRKPSSAEENN